MQKDGLVQILSGLLLFILCFTLIFFFPKSHQDVEIGKSVLPLHVIK